MCRDAMSNIEKCISFVFYKPNELEALQHLLALSLAAQNRLIENPECNDDNHTERRRSKDGSVLIAKTCKSGSAVSHNINRQQVAILHEPQHSNSN